MKCVRILTMCMRVCGACMDEFRSECWHTGRAEHIPIIVTRITLRFADFTSNAVDLPFQLHDECVVCVS